MQVVHRHVEVRMPLNRMHVRPLLTAAEFQLFESTVGDGLKALSGAQLRSKIKRTRTLRDKYVDLLRRQRLASRSRTGSKAGSSGSANERTGRKADVFAEVLTRLEKRLEQHDAAQARLERRGTATKAKARPGAGAAEKAAPPKKPGAAARKPRDPRPTLSPKAPARAPSRGGAAAVGPTGEGARGARQQMQLQSSRSKPIQAHLAARGKRAQARRDRRGAR
jgi:hypothetical protein